MKIIVPDIVLLFLLGYLWLVTKIAQVPVEANNVLRLVVISVLFYLSASILAKRITRVFFLTVFLFLVILITCATAVKVFSFP